ncbi:hypothetical protein [Nonomuraea zeae]|uniref:Uncharacterized protein n=1 Tax=Nonomuraea zeae TaxID=1642303 RepID=A0A5S4GPD2_9ACTN|nr:hypothetical protein [Nonomuraea zeae]TMR34826.1 hypothetical protein ETD85_15575 [Nonomuraea zeae]
MTFPSVGERRALVRSLVAEFAPEELPDFDLMTSAYFDSPAAARRARRARDEPGAFGIDLGDPTFTNLLWGVVGGLTTEMLVSAARRGRNAWKRRRREADGPDGALPELPPEQEPVVRERARDLLHRAGREDADAAGARLAERWARRDWTPPA